MNTHHSRRGAVDPLTLLVLGVVLLAAAPSGGPGKSHWWQFWKKNPIAEVEKQRDRVAAFDARIEASNLDLLHAAQEAAVATGAAIDAAQQRTAAGELPARELATAATLNRTNTQAMEQALGAPPPARVRELEQMVAQLNAGVAAGQQALALLQGTLDRAVAEKAAAVGERDQARADLAAATEKLGVFAAERDALARRYEQLTFWGRLAGLAGAALLVYLLFLWLRVRRLTSFGQDSVGLVEALKNEIGRLGGSPAREQAKEMIRRDWMTVADGSAALVEKFKSQLRL